MSNEKNVKVICFSEGSLKYKSVTKNAIHSLKRKIGSNNIYKIQLDILSGVKIKKSTLEEIKQQVEDEFAVLVKIDNVGFVVNMNDKVTLTLLAVLSN